MTPPHVLFVAATLFLGAGLYAAFSAPLNESQGVTWLGLAATIVATVIAAIVAARCALQAWRHPAADAMTPRAAIASLGVLALGLGVAAIVAGVVTHRFTASQPEATSTIIAPDASAASPTTFTIIPTATHPADLTHLVFALAFSAGVALLAALTLAFLRASDCDEANETSSAPAA